MEAGYRSGSKQRIRRAGACIPSACGILLAVGLPLRLALARCPEPAALQSDSAPVSRPSAPASTQPVSGRVLAVFSGDELVYNKTLGIGVPIMGWTTPANRGDGVQPGGGQGHRSGDGRKLGPHSFPDRCPGARLAAAVFLPLCARGVTVSAGQKLGKAATVSCECGARAAYPHGSAAGDCYLDPQN